MGMTIVVGDGDTVSHTHLDGYLENVACLKILGRSHDFRTKEQKRGFRFRLTIDPWFSIGFAVSIIGKAFPYEMVFSSGNGNAKREETFSFGEDDFRVLFSCVKPSELITFCPMKNYNGLLGVSMSLYLDGEEHYTHYPLYIENLTAQSVCSSMIDFLDSTLTTDACRERLREVQERFEHAVYFNWSPDSWVKCPDSGYKTTVINPPEMSLGETIVDESGQRFRIVEPGETNTLRLKPLGKHGKTKPKRLHYIAG
jgi:hypothetical protein